MKKLNKEINHSVGLRPHTVVAVSAAAVLCAAALSAQAQSSDTKFNSGLSPRSVDGTTLLAQNAAPAPTAAAPAAKPAKTSAPTLSESSERNLNRVFLGFRFGWDQKINFSGAPNASTFLTDYVDGYVNNASSWGYSQDAGATIQDGMLNLHGYSIAGGGGESSFGSANSGFIPGFELGYGREIYTTDLHEDVKFVIGGEFAVNFVHMDTDQSFGSSNLYRTTGRYELPGSIDWSSISEYDNPELGPQINPQNYGGPTTLVEGASFNQSQKFDYNELGFRIGPTFDFEICEKLTLGINGGFAFKGAWSEYRFNRDFAIEGIATGDTYNDKSNSDDLILGGYVGGRIGYKITPAVDVYAAVHQYFMDSYKHKSQTVTVRVDPRPLYLTVGVGYSF